MTPERVMAATDDLALAKSKFKYRAFILTFVLASAIVALVSLLL